MLSPTPEPPRSSELVSFIDYLLHERQNDMDKQFAMARGRVSQQSAFDRRLELKKSQVGRGDAAEQTERIETES